MTKRTQFGIRCKKCGDEIYSNYRHDFKSCKCGSCFIDGGFDYQRIGYETPDSYESVQREIELRNR